MIAGGLLVVAAAGVATAQPGTVPPQQGYPAPDPQPAQPAPPPQGYPGVPAPYAYQPQVVQLTVDEQDMLAHGEITDIEHLGGGLASLFLGFGTGQGIQRRWSDRGWIFTFGELASVAVMIYGATRTIGCIQVGNCRTDEGTGELIGGALVFGGLRIWEIVDAFAVPLSYNSDVRMLRARIGYRPQGAYGLYLAPPHLQEPGGVAGLRVRF
jgi:hypothetical protein